MDYSRTLAYETHSGGTSDASTLPHGFIITPMASSDWQLRYDFEKRISLESVLLFEPVEEGLYHQSFLMRVLRRIAVMAQGLREMEILVRDLSGGDTVA
jgi:hypothetical protein